MNAEKKVTLDFVSTAGDLAEAFPLHEPLRAVKHEVMGRVGLDQNQASDFGVFLEGNELDESKTLAELGLKDGTELFIQRREVVKVRV